MSTILVLKNGEKWGPYTTEELEGHVEQGTFTPEDLVWWEGLEEWQPLSSLFEEEEPPDFECEGVRVFPDRVELDGVSLLAPLILRASVQRQKNRRVKPVIGAVIVGVVAVCVAFVPIPRQNHTEWAIWSLVLLGLVVWCLRLMYAVWVEADPFSSWIWQTEMNGSGRSIPRSLRSSRPLSKGLSWRGALRSSKTRRVALPKGRLP